MRPTNHTIARAGRLAALVLAVFAMPAAAQTAEIPERGQPVKSLGLPQNWKFHLGGMMAWERRGDDALGAEAVAGVYRSVLNPAYGALGLVGEAYGRSVGGVGDGGLRLGAWSKFFALQMGADYSFRDEDVDFVMSITPAVRRGGLLHRGDNVRIDYYPGRSHSFNIGLVVPFRQRNMGRTRPYRDDVKLPYAPRHTHESVYAPGPELVQTLDALSHSADWINIYTTPFFDQDGKTDEEHMARFVAKVDTLKKHLDLRDGQIREGHSFNGEIRAFHRYLTRAFALAIAEPGGELDIVQAEYIADAAREALLDEVILPYDRLLGQRKQHDSVRPLCANAERVFLRWASTEPYVPARGRPGVMYVYRRLLDIVEANRQGAYGVWGDSRLVWIPLHYALRPEDHDTQEEIDALIERGVNTRFVGGNRVYYVVNELFHIELARMIHEAEDYHVLWIHDYRGRNPDGTPDEIGFRMTVEAYLQALIDRVNDYDRTWKIPSYFIFLDQFFFEANDGRLWMELLENPLHHDIDLPDGYEGWEETIRGKQRELRDAVAGSETLRKAQAVYGREWVENRVKVHVSITNPTDLTFRSRHLIHGLAIAPDILMRDHRKLSFYDVTELDPGRGEAIYTGMGVGEHYTGATWDDRALLVRGPALLTLKDEARRLLRSQGLEEDEIPPPLRPLPLPADYDERVGLLERAGWNTRGLQVHNATGYGLKRINMVKAMLYSLMPPGSHLYIPDSLWNSSLWGGFAVGAALRGCWVFPISPALVNAPSDGVPQMSRANELFTRFVVIQNRLQGEIEAAGGYFRVGVYHLDVGVGDLMGRSQVHRRTLAANPWLRTVVPFSKSSYAAIDSVQRAAENSDFTEAYLARQSGEHVPKLHMKAQLFLSADVASKLPRREEWKDIMVNYFVARTQHVRGLDDEGMMHDIEAAEDEAVALYRTWARGDETINAIAYLTVGSHNQDIRGKVMDGEVLYVASGATAMESYIDFISLMGETAWVATIDELSDLIPAHSGFWRWVGRHIRIML